MVKAPKHFIQIPVEITQRDDLTPVDKLVFGEIHTMLNITDKFWMSNNGIAKRIAKSKSTVRHSISHLIQKKLIATKLNYVNQNKSKRFIYDPRGMSKYGHTVRLNMDRGYGNIRTHGMSKYRHRIDQENRLKNRSMSISPREFTRIDNLYQKLFINENEKVHRAIHSWLATHSTNSIINAMKVTRDRCRSTNPNAVIGYIRAILNDHKRPKHKGDDKDGYYDHKINL